ncbi:protein EPIDERMAL PATTERNING FACTOR 2-like protein isoform X4 [Cinnamomum micranthum f. kanehirae]|uniref:Epidermal patterning factor-like protein n=1 Tax=Cinnamomum micranthum f. kanehirae TaxID=337451 RepID=A0A3S3R1Q8_9MAGN|nr:protein EPIDERMAL PATTERNING FACTOR 2-like protein isoform X4 [Cinnamomum micranthum f. kanehirae]
MKKFIFPSIRAHVILFAVIFLSVLTVGKTKRLLSKPDIQGDDLSGTLGFNGDRTPATPKGELGMELVPSGSTLPDCSHACGPCFPCKRVMVSYKCSVSESCPIVYRCMCKGRYYHVPSN